MTAAWYQEQVLEGVLLPFYDVMKMEKGDIVFQQDGAPSHNAKTTQKWFSDRNIPLFPHPPSSPDLNPIESVWHELKQRLQRRRHHPTSISELIAAVTEEWAGIDVEVIDRYTSRMDKVVEAVISAHGGHTQY